MDTPFQSGCAREGLAATLVEREKDTLRGFAVEHDLVGNVFLASFLSDRTVGCDDVDYRMSVEHEAVEGVVQEGTKY